jgi:hypothetical protein
VPNEVVSGTFYPAAVDFTPDEVNFVRDRKPKEDHARPGVAAKDAVSFRALSGRIGTGLGVR